MQSMTIDSAAIRLTDIILGQDEPDLEQALKAIAANIGVLHIAYVPLSSEKSEDANLLSAVCTYPVAWQARYFKKQYARIDPVIARGSEAVLPSTGMNCRGMIRPFEHFLTMQLIMMSPQWVLDPASKPQGSPLFNFLHEQSFEGRLALPRRARTAPYLAAPPAPRDGPSSPFRRPTRPHEELANYIQSSLVKRPSTASPLARMEVKRGPDQNGSFEGASSGEHGDRPGDGAARPPCFRRRTIRGTLLLSRAHARAIDLEEPGRSHGRSLRWSLAR